MLTSAAVARSQDQIAAVGEICGAAIQGAVDNVGLLFSKKGGASDKSKVGGVEGKLRALEEDLDRLEQEGAKHPDRPHHENTAGALKENIEGVYRDVGPTAKKRIEELVRQAPERVREFLGW